MDTLSISYPAMDDELTNPDDTKVSVKIGKKEFTEDRNQSLFELIQQGAFLSDGQLFNQINTIIESE
jgi:hypothetical protein